MQKHHVVPSANWACRIELVDDDKREREVKTKTHLQREFIRSLRCVTLDDMCSANGWNVYRGLFVNEKPVPLVVDLTVVKDERGGECEAV